MYPASGPIQSGKGLIWGGNGGVLDETYAEMDSPDDNVPYKLAVDCVLTALNGLWFTSDDPDLEDLTNVYLQQLKRFIQESI